MSKCFRLVLTFLFQLELHGLAVVICWVEPQILYDRANFFCR